MENKFFFDGLPDDEEQKIDEEHEDPEIKEEQEDSHLAQPVLPEPRCCCRSCDELFKGAVDSRKLLELSANVAALSTRDKNTWLFDFIKGCFKPHGNIEWTLFNRKVCKTFIKKTIGLSNYKIKEIKEYISNGMLDYPHDKAQRMSAPSLQLHKAHAWFQELYTDYAQTDSKGSEDKTTGIMEEVTISSPDHPLWAMAIGAQPSDVRKVPVKFVETISLESIYEMHERIPAEDQASRSTLRRAWDTCWKYLIKINPISHHARCSVCAELDERKKLAVDEAERAQLLEDKDNHVKDIKADRAVGARGQSLSEAAAASPSMDGHQQLLKLVVDGMDQAKFKVPRNITNSKHMSKLWRPQLSVTGVIAHGHLEAFFIMSPDIHKDANMEATVISRTLDLVQEKIKAKHASYCMPKSLVINADNTPREAKNSIFHTYVACLEGANRFSGTQVEFFKVGHTHNELDQRYSTAATTLSSAPTLEDPEEFRDWLLANLKPVRGRDLVVEILRGTMDFSQWQQPLGVQMTGITSTWCEKTANHVWRFVKRSDIALYVQPQLPWEVEPGCEQWQGFEQLPNDVVALYKESMHSSALSQMPLLVLPAGLMSGNLSKDDLKPAARKLLSDREKQEFLKTAGAIEKEPWNLHRGAAYLRQLVGDQDKPLPAIDFKFIHEHTTHTSLEQGPDVLGVHYAPDHVRRVAVQPPKRRAAPKSNPAEPKRRRRGQPEEGHAAAEVEHAAADEWAVGENAAAEVEATAAQVEISRADVEKARADGRLGCSQCRYVGTGCSTCKKYYSQGKPVGPARKALYRRGGPGRGVGRGAGAGRGASSSRGRGAVASGRGAGGPRGRGRGSRGRGTPVAGR